MISGCITKGMYKHLTFKPIINSTCGPLSLAESTHLISGTDGGKDALGPLGCCGDMCGRDCYTVLV